jgi:hypothetical protein
MGAGPEGGLRSQGSCRLAEDIGIGDSITKDGLSLASAERSRARRTDRDPKVLDPPCRRHAEPKGKIQDCDRDTLRAHHPFERGGISWPEARETECRQDLSGWIEGRTAGAFEELKKGQPPDPVGGGQARLCLQRHQSDGAIRGRKGMGDIASQGRHVSDLRSADEFARLHQGGHLAPQSGMLDDLAERDSRADQNMVGLESNFL